MPITINGTTGISGVDGSAATPAVIGSDADTGFVFAAGQVSASLNGTAANVPLVQGTAQNSTSGTSIDFTGIPSWAKRITVSFNNVSQSGAGTSSILVQIGTSGGIQNTGYLASVGSITGTNSTGTASATAGFITTVTVGAATVLHGNVVLTLVDSANGIWAAAGMLAGSGFVHLSGGTKTLSGTLDRVRIATSNGTDTFDLGSINILYE